MKRNSIFTIAGLLIFLLLCFVPNGAAQQATPLTQSPGTPWQLGLSWNFTSASGATGAFTTTSYSYWRIWWKVTGTVSGCSLSLDSITNGTPTIGGILPAATIGSCASSSSYVTTTATVPASLAQITPTITGTGSVLVAVLGYTDNPAAGGSIGGSVAVTNFPATQPVSGTLTSNAGSGTFGTQDAATGTSGSAVPSKSMGISGKNSGNLVPVATDSSGNVGVNIQNTTATAGPTNVTSTQAVAVTVGGASEVQIAVTGTWTGTIQPKASGDGTNYSNALVHPTNPNGPWQSTITANGTYAANVAAGNSFEAIGNTVATGTAVVTVTASPGMEDVVSSGLNTPADAASTPTDAVHDQSWPMGWNGSSSDRLRTAGVGNTVAATGILAAAAYCEFLTSLPTLTNATYGIGQCDAKGQLMVDLNYVLGAIMSATNPTYERLTDGTTAVAACVSAYGTAPTGTECMGFNVNMTNVPNVYLGPNSLAAEATSPASESSLTTAVVVKASAGNLYGFQVTNGSASVCYLQFINVASGPTLGTTAVYSFAVPASGTLTLAPGSFALSHFTTGISVGMSTTYNGSSACGTAATGVIFYN